ncbi:MAG: DUF3499 family protein [Nitriliruptoraceae bacterium]|nr:DUF3499 family protein [Nitriliruptoraceae bacterium]
MATSDATERTDPRGTAALRVVAGPGTEGRRRPTPAPARARMDAARAVRECARPGCRASARATLSFAYAGRVAVLAGLADQVAPQTYDLCGTHAARTTPPRGWALEDRRPVEERQPTHAADPIAGLGGDRTVAVLAEALRSRSGIPSREVSDDPVAAPTLPDPVVAPVRATAETRPPLAARERPS